MGPGIDQFGFKNIISLHPPYLGGFQEHDKRWVFQTMYCFSSGTGVCLGHCIIFCLSWKPPRYGGRHALETELVYRMRKICWACVHVYFACNAMIGSSARNAPLEVEIVHCKCGLEIVSIDRGILLQYNVALDRSLPGITYFRLYSLVDRLSSCKRSSQRWFEKYDPTQLSNKITI